VGAPFAIVLDNEVISAPVIRQAITGGSGQITGNFTVESSTELAVLLRAGALPAEMTFLEERTIGPELGADSIAAGELAAVVAFAAVLVFMVLSYGLFGVFASVALILNVGLIFGVLSLIGATLTLPGIAGIVLTIGMAVDANVLVFERIREEMKTAKGPARAIELGYERALSAIIDANLTTFIIAVILFVLGSGPVRGFSVTLGIGILTSVFTAIFVTRLLIVTWFDRRAPRRSRSEMRLRLVPDETKLDFFKYARLTFGASVVAMVLSSRFWLTMGLNFGIDFLGGTTIRTESARARGCRRLSRRAGAAGPGRRVDHGGLRPDLRRRPERGDDPHPGPGRAGKRDARDHHGGAGRAEDGLSGDDLSLGGIGRAQGVGRVDPDRDDRRGRVARRDPDLHLAQVRMAVLGGRGGRRSCMT
jgi:SecD/SecF fusion protein